MRSRGLVRRLACLVVICGGLPAAGCGAAGDRAESGTVAERFYTAAARATGGPQCAQLSADTRAQLVQDSSGRPCRRAVLDLSLRGRRVASVRVYATSSQVRLPGGHSVVLGVTPRWRIDAVGCMPRGSGHADREASS